MRIYIWECSCVILHLFPEIIHVVVVKEDAFAPRRHIVGSLRWITMFATNFLNDWDKLKYEMVGWHHQLDGHEFEQALGVGDGQGSLVCCSPWGHKDSDMTERLNWYAYRSVSSSVYTCAQLPSHIWLFETPWTVTHQAQTLSMRFPRQVYWSELPFPSPIYIYIHIHVSK